MTEVIKRSKPTSTFRPISDKTRLWGYKETDVLRLQSNFRRVLFDLCRIFISNRTAPVILWGPPGSRKTRTLEALNREVDENGVRYQVITVQPSTEDPTVIHGMMFTSLDGDSGETIMKRSIPDIANQVVKYFDETGGLTILFLDEMTTCMPAQQNALLGILTHGKYGDVDIQPYISVVMAANPENTVSTVHALGEQVINRGGHLPWYGDMDLFLEDWRSGFNGATTSPDSLTDWYMTTLMMEKPEEVFRSSNGNWKTDDLVPYSLIENSERSMTENSKIVKLINEIFADCPDDIRHFYIVSATRAILGETWADRMQMVCAKEKKRVPASYMIDLVKGKSVQRDWEEAHLKGILGIDLYIGPSGTRMSQDQIQSVAIEIMTGIKEEFNLDAALALWSFAASAPDSGTTAALHLHLVALLMETLQAVNSGVIEPLDAKVPEFVSAEVKVLLKAAASRSV